MNALASDIELLIITVSLPFIDILWHKNVAHSWQCFWNIWQNHSKLFLYCLQAWVPRVLHEHTSSCWLTPNPRVNPPHPYIVLGIHLPFTGPPSHPVGKLHYEVAFQQRTSAARSFDVKQNTDTTSILFTCW